MVKMGLFTIMLVLAMFVVGVFAASSQTYFVPFTDISIDCPECLVYEGYNAEFERFEYKITRSVSPSSSVDYVYYDYVDGTEAKANFEKDSLGI